MTHHVRLATGDIDIAAELNRLAALGGGGVASFIGIVRGEGGLTALELEHYPAMTLAAMTAIADEAVERWPLIGLTLIHRHGRLAPGARIVLVGAAAAHRGAAIDAVHFLIDWLKTRAPFWKREHFADGAARWVAPREDDARAAGRWENAAE